MNEARLSGFMQRVVELYPEMQADSLDLHTLLEAGGNDPDSRRQVLTAVANLIELGYLEPTGSDYYALTARGRKLLKDVRD